MSLIALEGMQFYAYHGVYDEEQIIGNNYVIDIYISTNYSKAIQKFKLIIKTNMPMLDNMTPAKTLNQEA